MYISILRNKKYLVPSQELPARLNLGFQVWKMLMILKVFLLAFCGFDILQLMTKLKFWLICSLAKKTIFSLTWAYSQFKPLSAVCNSKKWLLLGLLMAFLHLASSSCHKSSSKWQQPFAKKKRPGNFSASQFAFFESHFAAGIMKRVSQISYFLIYTAKTQINLCVNIMIEVAIQICLSYQLGW